MTKNDEIPAIDYLALMNATWKVEDVYLRGEVSDVLTHDELVDDAGKEVHGFAYFHSVHPDTGERMRLSMNFSTENLQHDGSFQLGFNPWEDMYLSVGDSSSNLDVTSLFADVDEVAFLRFVDGLNLYGLDSLAHHHACCLVRDRINARYDALKRQREKESLYDW